MGEVTVLYKYHVLLVPSIYSMLKKSFNELLALNQHIIISALISVHSRPNIPLSFQFESWSMKISLRMFEKFGNKLVSPPSFRALTTNSILSRRELFMPQRKKPSG